MHVSTTSLSNASTFKLVAFLCATLYATGAGRADFVMSLTQDGSIGSFTVDVGASVDVPIYLLQTNL